ncbi:MAG: hypothetical protein FH749_10495 [Firmicutes bacterium]|nr:hypothetical protein [Bacillota bacterium]
MREDLEEFLHYYQLIHPAYRTDPELAAAFEATYDEIFESIDKPLAKTEFMLELMRIVKPLDDGHALIYYRGEVESLPIRFAWLEEGPVVTISQSDKIERGDQIISINDKDAADILAELHEIISTENIYWVRHRGAGLLTHDYTLRAGFTQQ